MSGIDEQASFSADWLALRRAADARARDPGLTALAAQWLARRQVAGQPLRLLDLGSGSGANPAFLAARLPGPQAWQLFDHDRGLLARAAAHCAALRDPEGRSPDFASHCADLRQLCAADLAGFDLVSASALLDLLDGDWLLRFAAACRKAQAAVLITLSVDGGWHFEAPQGFAADPDDDFIRAAFNAHQRGDKGVGGALGAEAVPQLSAALAAQDYTVHLAPSPWRLRLCDPPDAALARALIDGWRSAAAAQCPAAAERIAAWHARRVAGWKAAQWVLEVGHVDLFATPPAAGPCT